MEPNTPTTSNLPVSNVSSDALGKKKNKRVILIVVIVAVVIGIAIILAIALTSKPSTSNNSSSFSTNYPECPADLSGLLTYLPMDLSTVDFIEPLGMTNSSSHAIPTDHMYINHAVPETRIPIYSPGNLTLTAIENKVVYDSATDAWKRDDYQFELVVCRGLVIQLIHFSELNPTIQEVYDNTDVNCSSGKYYFGSDTSEYYRTCDMWLEYPVAQGELLGYIGGLPHQRGIDLGAYNYNSVPLAFLVPERYSENNLHTMCPLDLFSADLKADYFAKVGNWDEETGFFVPSTVDPICGAIMYDVAGTASGNWFAGISNEGNVTQTEYMMSLSPNDFDHSLLDVAIKGPESLGNYVDFNFTPIHEGLINRVLTEVRADGQVYCYQSKVDNGEKVLGESFDRENSDRSYELPSKYLLRLIDDTHMEVERQYGDCTGMEVLSDPMLWER